MQEMQGAGVRPLGREDLLGEETATRSSIPAWETPWTEESVGLQSVPGVTKSRTRLSGLAPVLTDTPTDGLPPWGPVPGGW